MATPHGLPLDPGEYADFANVEEAASAIVDHMTEPWPWNQWQKMLSQLMTMYREAQGSVGETQKYSTQLRKRLMTEKFGEGWQKQTANTIRREAAAQPVGPADVGDAAPAAQPEDGQAAAQRGLPLSAPPAQNGLPALEDGSAPPGAVSSAGGAAASGAGVAGELLTEKAVSIFDEFRGHDSETSSACDARVEGLIDRLSSQGLSEAAVAQGAKIEYYGRSLLKEYMGDETADHSPDGAVVWAVRVYDEQRYLTLGNESEAEAFLIALGRMAQLNSEQLMKAMHAMQVFYRTVRPESPGFQTPHAGRSPSRPQSPDGPAHHELGTPRGGPESQ